MLKKAVPNLKRWVSGYLVAVITLMLVFNNSFALSALAAETASESNAESRASTSDAIKNSRVTLKNRSVSDKDVDDVQMFVLSDHRDYQPGDTVCLELYIKNNTDEVISDGLLRFKAKGIEEDSAYFEDLNDLYMKVVEAEEKAAEAEAAIKESEKQAEESQEQKEEREAQAAENQEQEGSGEQAEEDEKEEGEASSENQAEQAEPSGEAETAEERSEAGNSGSKEAEETLQTAEPETTAREEINVIGEVSGELDESDTTDNDDTDSEDEEEEDPTRITEIEIEPGRAYYVNFYYTIDPEIEKIKDQNVEFTFSWADDDAIIKRPSVKEIFRYTVDGLNLLPVVTGGEKGWVQIGEEDEMLLEFDLGRIEEVLEEAEMEELEKNPEATVSAARRSSASNAWIGWDAEDDGKLKGKSDPAVVRNLKLEVETFDIKLNEFKVVPVDEKTDDNFGTTVACKFKVSRKNEPGTHFGKVTASYRIKGKTYHTTQAFCVKAKPEEGEMELTGKIGEAEIVMYGDVSAFPKADELSLKISEVTKEQQEMVEEALRKKSEEEGVEITEYKALDIKLIADGNETEPDGEVKVRFKNVKVEEPEKDKKEAENPAEAEIAGETVQEKSVVRRFMRKVRTVIAGDEEEAEALTNLPGEKEEGTEEAARESDADKQADEVKKTDEPESSNRNIKVLHLNEEDITASEMKSEIEENGDIVMDTTHFSIYIVVNLPDGILDVPITVRHRAIVDKWEFEDGKLKESSFKKDGSPLDTVNRPHSGKPTATDFVYTDTILYPGAKGYDTATKKPTYDKLTDSETSDDLAYQGIKLYETDQLKLPNGGGTGINNEGISYRIAVSEWSKVSAGGNYTVKSVYVKNRFYPNGRTFNEPLPEEADNNENSVNVIKLAETGNEITIYYEPTEGDLFSEVGFHDYNVTIDSTTEEARQAGEGHRPYGSNGKQIRSNKVGMNSLSLDPDQNSSKERIGIGIRNNSDSGINHNYPGRPGDDINKSAGEICKSDISLSEIKIGASGKYEIEFNYFDPGLFTVPALDENTNQRELIVKEQWKGQEVDYIAKHYINDYQLKFFRKGDTYVLTDVLKPGGGIAATELDHLIYTTANWNTGKWVQRNGKWVYNPEKPLYTNLFWPMDSAAYGNNGIPGKTMDYEFGKKVVTTSDGSKYDSYGFPVNDEDAGAHNWFFGMRYDVEFSVGDYTGPMDYYFRGDDDFWLYIDGERVVDLGGIHQAAGYYVDLRKWLEDRNLLSGTHTMSVFFMERGGTGSCCYMTFTLPNVVPVPTPEAATISKTVTKKWIDYPDNAVRKPITVKLYQDGKEFGSVVLSEKNQWTHTWNNLPQFSMVDSTKECIYTVKEENVEGYTSYVEGLTIRNVRNIDIPVEKTWTGDEGSAEGEKPYKPDSVTVELYENLVDIPASGTAQRPSDNDPGWKKIKTENLSETNDWKYVWSDMPLGRKEGGSWKQIFYKVKETPANWLKTSDADTNGWYKVSYSGDATNGFTVSNEYIDETATYWVKKQWEDKVNDADNAFGLRPDNITVQLQRKNESGEFVPYPDEATAEKVLNDAADWFGEWKDLPKWNYTKETKTEGGKTVTTITRELYQYKVIELENYTNSEYYESSSVVSGPGEKPSGSSEPVKGDAVLTTITNTLKAARLRVKKFVNNTNREENEPIREPYKFLVKIEDGAGNEYTVALTHDNVSGYILVPMKGIDEKSFVIKEIVVPMEYTLEGMERLDKGGAEFVFDRTSGEGEITLVPNDDALVQVNNVPEHTDYFHHTYSVTNENSMSSKDGFINVNKKPVPSNIYDEKHGYEQEDKVRNQTSSDHAGRATEYEYVVAYTGGTIDGKERKWDWGDDLNA